MSGRVRRALWLGISLAMLIGLPLIGVWIKGVSISKYAEFPPLTWYVPHADFSWIHFVALAVMLLAVILPFDIRVYKWRKNIDPGSSLKIAFPWWGWLGLVLIVTTWLLAWNRFTWFAPFQQFTFSPIWFGYVLVINGLTLRRTGRCMLKDRPKYFILLFLFSAVFWWFFEYLNRFVQNWYYEGIQDLSSLQYFLFATLPFSTVLPAVMGTYELLDSYPRIGAGLDDFARIEARDPRTLAWPILSISAGGLALIGLYPSYLFPLLWLSPLCIMTALRCICGEATIFARISKGKWRKLYLLAMAALICGFLWEMWNFFSVAKWIYEVPFVHKLTLFEMPILGYAGYLPFGLECAVIAELVCDAFCKKTGMAKTLRPADAKKESFSERAHRIGKGLLALGIATAIWLPSLHIFFKQDVYEYFGGKNIPPKAHALASRHIELWSNPSLRKEEITRMRASNAEWDFMGRTFLVLSLSNMALREPSSKGVYLDIMDSIIDETIRLEKEHGIYYFLLDYARTGNFVAKPGRSIFQDGEIALMLAARRLVEEKSEYKPLLQERVELMVKCMKQSPVFSGESYPNECWVFCNSIALAAIKASDALDGLDHSEFLDEWIKAAKQELVHSDTGLLISSYGFDGTPFDGPEGSSIWLAAHCLQLVDGEFAEDQYRRAKKELGKTLFGCGYAKEWPESWRSPVDIDSGPVIPIVEISAGSSGLAFVGASAFGDFSYLQDLLTSLEFGGFPIEKKGQLRYCASNQVGDAVMLYAMVMGPLWDLIERRCDGDLSSRGAR